MFQSLSRLFARRPEAPPARKASLGLHLLEARDCPAALAAMTHDVVHHAPADGHHDQPSMMMAARVRPGLNPQPLPP